MTVVMMPVAIVVCCCCYYFDRDHEYGYAAMTVTSEAAMITTWFALPLVDAIYITHCALSNAQTYVHIHSTYMHNCTYIHYVCAYIHTYIHAHHSSIHIHMQNKEQMGWL